MPRSSQAPASPTSSPTPDGFETRESTRGSNGSSPARSASPGAVVSARGGLIRIARRPAGWTPPGPPPAGPGDDPELEPAEGEDLCFLTGEWRIFQRIDGHRWSLDDLVTAWSACREIEPARVGRAIDIGCGIGSVLMMVAWRLPQARMVGIEAQSVSACLARRSLVYNGIVDRVELRFGDLRDPSRVPEGPVFDLVTGTPPYFPFGTGHVSDKVQCGPCRFESRGGIEAYCEAASRLLAPEGSFVVCESADQVARVEAAARDHGLVMVRRCDVVPRAGKRPLVAVFSMRRAGASAVEASGQVFELIVRDRDGRWTPEFSSVRLEMGLPPTPP